MSGERLAGLVQQLAGLVQQLAGDWMQSNMRGPRESSSAVAETFFVFGSERCEKPEVVAETS